MPKHGGYKDLKSFQNSEIVYDFTMEFCQRHVESYGSHRTDTTDKTYRAKRQSRQTDQMVQAARSGVQNIAEGSSNSATSKQTELRLINVARGSLEELLRDYKDFLRQRNLPEWGKDDTRAIAVRQLAYRSDKSYTTYRTYMQDSEAAANAAICLIFQTTYLLDQQMRALEKELFQHGDIKEQFRYAREDERKRQLFDNGPPLDEFLAEFGMRRKADGQVEAIDKQKFSD